MGMHTLFWPLLSQIPIFLNETNAICTSKLHIICDLQSLIYLKLHHLCPKPLKMGKLAISQFVFLSQQA